jgi:hypothetical protein
MPRAFGVLLSVMLMGTSCPNGRAALAVPRSLAVDSAASPREPVAQVVERLALSRGLAPGTAYAPQCSPRWTPPRRARGAAAEWLEVCIDSSDPDTLVVWVIGSGFMNRPLPPRADSLRRELVAGLAPYGVLERAWP